jgi:hypothetical protein
MSLITREQLTERDILRTFRLDGFTMYACEPTEAEWRSDTQRNYITIVIFARGEDKGLVVPVGSPIIMMRGESWDEIKAARTALSFAADPQWDDEDERAWVDDHGDALTSAAYCHRVLGTELRA